MTGALLAAHITASRVNPDSPGNLRGVNFRVGGLAENEDLRIRDQNASEHFRWPVVELNIGDRISVEIVDVDDVDAPEERYIRSPTSAPEK